MPGPEAAVATALMERLWEDDDALPGAFPLPVVVESAYGGQFGLAPGALVANFVQSLDGVVAIPDVEASPGVISAGDPGDRFVMALLRASAGAVLIGASTLRAEPEHRWTPEFVQPSLAEELAELRAALGLAARPELFVLTASGELDVSAGALGEGAVVLTTERGAQALGASGLPGATEVVVVERAGTVGMRDAIDAIRARGHDVVLSEGGPTVLGQLLRERLLDELFLTFSPTLFGRLAAGPRPALVEGVDLLGDGLRGRLLSLRRHGSHLFARYAVRGGAAS